MIYKNEAEFLSEQLKVWQKRYEDLLRYIASMESISTTNTIVINTNDNKISKNIDDLYHPCTQILIDGLKKLPGGNKVLLEWDNARRVFDEKHFPKSPTIKP